MQDRGGVRRDLPPVGDAALVAEGDVSLEVDDERTYALDEVDACTKPAPTCKATVGDLAECARSRLTNLCGIDSPRCAVIDACRRGVYRR